MNTEKPKTIADCTAGIESLIKSGAFRTGTDCMSIISLLRKSCAFQDDTHLANFATIARHDMKADNSDGTEDAPEYTEAVKKLDAAGADIEQMRKCFSKSCPLIRAQVFMVMAFQSQI